MWSVVVQPWNVKETSILDPRNNNIGKLVSANQVFITFIITIVQAMLVICCLFSVHDLTGMVALNNQTALKHNSKIIVFNFVFFIVSFILPFWLDLYLFLVFFYLIFNNSGFGVSGILSGRSNIVGKLLKFQARVNLVEMRF